MPELARFRAIHRPVDAHTLPSAASILHVDMDAFFVSVELLERPELRGNPVIVGGGRQCPLAVFLYGHHSKYSEWSDRVATILAKFSPIVEMVSIDEAYLDLS